MRVPLLCGGGPLQSVSYSVAVATHMRDPLPCGCYSRAGPTPMRLLLQSVSYSVAVATPMRIPLPVWVLLHSCSRSVSTATRVWLLLTLFTLNDHMHHVYRVSRFRPNKKRMYKYSDKLYNNYLCQAFSL